MHEYMYAGIALKCSGLYQSVYLSMKGNGLFRDHHALHAMQYVVQPRSLSVTTCVCEADSTHACS